MCPLGIPKRSAWVLGENIGVINVPTEGDGAMRGVGGVGGGRGESIGGHPPPCGKGWGEGDDGVRPTGFKGRYRQHGSTSPNLPLPSPLSVQPLHR